jgi:hypothetical protein
MDRLRAEDGHSVARVETSSAAGSSSLETLPRRAGIQRTTMLGGDVLQQLEAIHLEEEEQHPDVGHQEADHPMMTQRIHAEAERITQGRVIRTGGKADQEGHLEVKEVIMGQDIGPTALQTEDGTATTAPAQRRE